MKLSPPLKVEERLTPFLLVPQHYPDGRVVFLEHDSSASEWFSIAVMLVPVLLISTVASFQASHPVIVWGARTLAIILLLSLVALVAQIIRYVPLNRALVVDTAQKIVGLRETRRGRVEREWTLPLAQCRIERGYLGTSRIKSLDQPVLVFIMPHDDGEIHVVLAAVWARYLDEYSALLPASLRSQIVVTSEHRVIHARPAFAYKDADGTAIRKMRYCAKCGYDLIGLDSSRCPECGLGRWNPKAL